MRIITTFRDDTGAIVQTWSIVARSSERKTVQAREQTDITMRGLHRKLAEMARFEALSLVVAEGDGQ